LDLKTFRITEGARRTIDELKKRGHPRLFILIDDPGCCSFSSVFVTESSNTISSGWEKLWEGDGAEVHINKQFHPYGEGWTTVLDVVSGVEDDSFSLETAFSERLVLRYVKNGQPGGSSL
jgi:uncharacterized protein (DUF779 family)